MTLFDYFQILIRNFWFIIISTVIVTIISIFYVYNKTPIYKAECKLLIVDVNKSGTLLDQSDLILSGIGKSDPLITQIEVITTRSIFDEVIKRCDLKNSEGLPVKPGALAARVNVTPIRASNIIEVSYMNKDPIVAANIVNTFAQVAGEENQRLNREDIHTMRLFIEQQLESQKARLEDLEQASVNFKKREKTVSIDLQTRSQIENAAQIESEIMKLESERQGTLAQKNQIETSLSAPRAQADPFYVSRLNMLEQIKTKLSSIEAQKSALSRQLKTLNFRLASRPQEEVNLTRFLRDEKIAEAVYTNLLTKLQELEIKEAARTASIKQIEPAVAPDFPISPKKKKIMMVSMLAGFVIGYCIAFIITILKMRSNPISIIKHLLPVEIIGTVPVINKKEPIIFKTSACSKAADKIRYIHLNLLFGGLYEKKHSNLLVTSASAGEGKSIVCANLIYPFAEVGRKVALVNLNLRSTVFQNIFKLKRMKGVADFLSSKAEFNEIVSHQHNSNGVKFDVIDGGEIVSTSAHLFLQEKADEFFKQLTNMYDVCLFYSAPILYAAETSYLCRYMDGIILVIDIKASNSKHINAMRELIENKKLPFIGTIVNRTNESV